MKKYILTALILILYSQYGHCQKSTDPSKSVIIIETSMGDIEILLYNDTPKHKDNMLMLVKEGFYQDLQFHRVIKDFMIQGGDPLSRNAAPETALGSGGPGYKIAAEFLPNRFHKRGALAAAREGDIVNPEKSSSGSQFYIVQGTVFTEAGLEKFRKKAGLPPFSQEAREAYTSIGGTPHLDRNYTVFGEVITGLDVVEKISLVKTLSNRPVDDVVFSIRVKD